MSDMGTCKKENSMSEHFKNLRGDTPFGAASPQSQRELAVAAALTLTQAKVLKETLKKPTF